MERPLLLFRRSANTPILCAAFFLTWSTLIDMSRPGQPCIKGHPKEKGGSTQWVCSPKSRTGRGVGMRLQALAKSIAVLFETLMEILHSLIHRSRSPRYDAMKLSSSAGWRDVDKMAILSAKGANSTWWECLDTSLTYRLKRTGDIIPPSTTPVRMKRQVDGALWKDASNVRPCREEQMVFTRY